MEEQVIAKEYEIGKTNMSGIKKNKDIKILHQVWKSGKILIWTFIHIPNILVYWLQSTNFNTHTNTINFL